jgi:signal transduction histidine kinase
MVIALFYARRLTRPLEDFAEAAGRLATGDRRQMSRRYGIAELDAVADVLDQGASNFNDLLESERRVTAETSHQLRTPLTALSLRLEEILASDDLEVVHAEATAALGQVERLSGVVDDVVSVSRGFPLGPQSRYSLDALVDRQVLEWTPTFQAGGRALRSLGLSGLEIDGAFGAQSQALGTLIENALQHGAGGTTVRVRSSGTWAVIEVSDEGDGVAPEVESHVFERNVSGGNSSGLGLALARTLVSADGGRLELLSARPAVFAMFLPAIQVSDESAVALPPRAVASAEGSPEQTQPESSRSAAPQRDGVAADGDQSRVAQATVEMAASSAASVSSGKTHRR